MAGWQFCFHIIENNKFNYNGQIIKGEDEDNYFTWPYKLMAEIKARIPSVLVAEKSWSKDIFLYGDLDNTCIEILKLDNMAGFQIGCRLSLAIIDAETLNHIFNFIKSIGGALVFSNITEYIVYEATKENLVDMIKRSSPYRVLKTCRCDSVLYKFLNI